MFESIESFQQKIYILKQKTNQNLIETLVQYCDEHSMEFESIQPFVTGKLKSDLREEFEQLHFLPKTRKIPIFLYNNG